MSTLDPLSDVFRLLDARSLYSGSFVAGDWAVRFQGNAGVKFNALGRGSAWLVMDGAAPVHLQEGDCFVTCRSNSFVVASALHLPEIAAETLFTDARGEVRCGDSEQVLFIGGQVELGVADAGLLTASLPRLLVLPGGTARATPIRWLLEQLLLEARGDDAGRSIICNDLIRMMFIHALRAHLDSTVGPTSGWLAGMADRRLRAALRCIHDDPARTWTLVELASAAGMSRSGFALHFKQTLGVAPVEYLLRWRMRLAAKRLRTGREPASVIAASLGYLSDSAFSNAFKRVVGSSPMEYRRQSCGYKEASGSRSSSKQ